MDLVQYSGFLKLKGTLPPRGSPHGNGTFNVIFEADFVGGKPKLPENKHSGRFWESKKRTRHCGKNSTS